MLFPWEDGFSLGWYVVTALGLPLLGSLVTGLVVYKRFWRTFYRPRLRLSQGSRTAWGDAHRLIGVWSIWFIAVIAVSGGWFLVTTVLTDLGVEVFPAAPQLASDAVPPAAPGGVPFAPDPEAASRAAVAAIPDMTVRYLRMPESAHGPVTAMGDRGLSLYGPFGNRVFVDPYSGTVIAVQRSEDMATLQAASRMLGALHVGSFGGLWIKLVWFVFGLALSAMILSGIVIWTKRTAQATARLHKSGSGRAADPSPAVQ